MEEHARRELVERLADFQNAAEALGAAWARTGTPDAIEAYPFEKSFDELTNDIMEMYVRSIRIPPEPRRVASKVSAGHSGVGIPTRGRSARAV